MLLCFIVNNFPQNLLDEIIKKGTKESFWIECFNFPHFATLLRLFILFICIIFGFLFIVLSFVFFHRVKNRLDSLTTSLIAWKQFENGLNEFKEVLGKDTGALKCLTGALESGSDVKASDVKEVAKRLSEKMNNNNSMATAAGQQVIRFFIFII